MILTICSTTIAMIATICSTTITMIRILCSTFITLMVTICSRTIIVIVLVLQLFCRCKIPGYDNDTFLEQSDYHRQLINMSIPDPDDPDSIYKYDRCHLIQYKSNVSSQVKCTEWVYDKSVFQETFASKVGIGLIVIWAVSFGRLMNHLLWTIFYVHVHEIRVLWFLTLSSWGLNNEKMHVLVRNIHV